MLKPANKTAQLILSVALGVAILTGCSSGVDQSDAQAVVDAYIEAVLTGDMSLVRSLSIGSVDHADVELVREEWTGSAEPCESTRKDTVLTVDEQDYLVYSFDWLETTTSSDGSRFNEEGHALELTLRGGEWFVQRTW